MHRVSDSWRVDEHIDDDYNDTQTIARPFQFNSVQYIAVPPPPSLPSLCSFCLCLFVFVSCASSNLIFFFLSFRLVLRCPVARTTPIDPESSQRKVVLTVAKIEFLFNLYGFVALPLKTHFVASLHMPPRAGSLYWNLFHIIALLLRLAAVVAVVVCVTSWPCFGNSQNFLAGLVQVLRPQLQLT